MKRRTTHRHIPQHVRAAMAQRENKLTRRDLAALYGDWTPGTQDSPLAQIVHDLVLDCKTAYSVRTELFRVFREWWGDMPADRRLQLAVEVLDAADPLFDGPYVGLHQRQWARDVRGYLHDLMQRRSA